MAVQNNAYDKAHRMAVACCEKDKATGRDPYLPVLDTILKGIEIQKETRTEIKEIDLSQVVGTKTQGRTQAFASNFMPLLEPSSEFADKWTHLYIAQTTEGIRDPIQAYELFGYYFVQEGNKRVSVLKFCNAPVIAAEVREVILNPASLDPKGKELYTAYLEFKQAVPLNDLVMSKASNYSKLMKILDVSPENPMSAQQAKDLRSLYVTFTAGMEKTGLAAGFPLFSEKPIDQTPDNKLPKTMGDAFLQYLSTYGFTPDVVIPQSMMLNELEKLSHINPQRNGVYVMTGTEGSEKKKSLLSTFFTGLLPVAFICSGNEKSSVWTQEHLEAIQIVKETMADQVKVTVYENCNTKDEIKQAIQSAIQDGNEVIFTTNPSMLQIANQVAANYPKLKILNNSLNLDTGLLRTYYAREYEVQFLLGILAGVMSENGNIGYLASYPIYGTVASINAFAIGVGMTNPRAKIYLDWTTTRESLLKDFPVDLDILYIEGNKFDTSIQEGRKFGLFNVGTGQFFNIATVKTNWAVFYQKILKSILNNTWTLDHQKSGNESINYWWGLSNGLLELEFSDKLPLQVQRLATLLRDDMAQGTFIPFEGLIEDQDKQIHDWSDGVFLPNLATMDWLNSNIIGSIPTVSQLEDNAKEIVALHGVNKAKEIE